MAESKVDMRGNVAIESGRDEDLARRLQDEELQKMWAANDSFKRDEEFACLLQGGNWIEPPSELLAESSNGGIDFENESTEGRTGELRSATLVGQSWNETVHDKALVRTIVHSHPLNDDFSKCKKKVVYRLDIYF